MQLFCWSSHNIFWSSDENRQHFRGRCLHLNVIQVVDTQIL